MARKTFVLEWNPAISSYNWEQFESDFNEGEVPWSFNWSIWDHNEAHRGDRFVMIKCGDGKTGIAQMAHKGTVDLDGNPVILHPLAVCHAGKTDLEKVVGLLHDVVEDTEWTFEMLRDYGISETAIEAVRLLTRDKDVPYMDYVKAICESGNALALQVKINDLNNNIQRGTKSGLEHLVRKHTTALNYIISYQNKKSEQQ